MAFPLYGKLVIALEQAVAGPFCTVRLADAGARVIKIERADGDFARGYDDVVSGESAYFVWLNRGKESVCLDIKNESDKILLHNMLSEADIFVQNLAPGAAARAGFESARLRDENPRLITVDITGYGESGPYRDMKAYDLLVQCESGLASVTGSPVEPGRVGISICDIACGMYAHAAILQALLQREQTGRGQGLSVSLFDAMADWMTVPLMHQLGTGNTPPRVGLNHPSIAPYGAYTTADGSQVVIAVQSNREWINFCKYVLQKPELGDNKRYATNSDRCKSRAALDREIKRVFSALKKEKVIGRLKKGNIAYGSVNSILDLASHPQLRHASVALPDGEAQIVAAPVKSTEGPASFGAVPSLGEHSDEITKEFKGD